VKVDEVFINQAKLGEALRKDGSADLNLAFMLILDAADSGFDVTRYKAGIGPD
jgi:hypothetical protein